MQENKENQIKREGGCNISIWGILKYLSAEISSEATKNSGLKDE